MMDCYFELIGQLEMDEIIEMSRELREISEMSPSERDIYALFNPDADVFTTLDREEIEDARNEILMILN